MRVTATKICARSAFSRCSLPAGRFHISTLTYRREVAEVCWALELDSAIQFQIYTFSTCKEISSRINKGGVNYENSDSWRKRICR